MRTENLRVRRSISAPPILTFRDFGLFPPSEIREAAGRAPDPRKRGAIPPHVQSVLESLRINVERWLDVVTKPAGLVGTAIGSAVSLAKEAARRGVRRIIGALDICAD